MSSLMWRSRDRFGLAWQEGLPGIALQSTCCAPEARQSLTVTARLLQRAPVFNGSGTKTHSPRNQDKSNWDKRDR